MCVVPCLPANTANATDTLPWGLTNPSQAVGKHQPYQHGYTAQDVLEWDFTSDPYAQYLRARVPLQTRIEANASTQYNPDLAADTQLLNLAGDYGNAFFESFHDNNVFSQYLFNYWQYVDFYASWHGMPTNGVSPTLYDPSADWTQKWFEFGMLNLPNPAYTNAAHANGSKSLGCIFFSDNDRGEQTYQDLLVGKDEQGVFPVATKLVQIANYFGFDGYFINQESDVDRADTAELQAFLKQLHDAGLYVQWYDSAVYPQGTVDYQNVFDDANDDWLVDTQNNTVSDSIFLNYWYNGEMIKRSAEHAQSLGLDPKLTVFAGIEAGKEKFDTIAKNAEYMRANLDDDGNAQLSLAVLGSDFVSHELGDDLKVYPQYQNQVFDRERRLWTGSSAGLSGETQDGWNGFASQIAERSVIGGSVFDTTFNTGHGLAWYESGNVSSANEWGSMNLQSQLPTWQWWVEAESDPLSLDFDYGPQYVSADRFSYDPIGAYEGGSSLVVSGNLSSENTIRLFKTDLQVTSKSSLNMAIAQSDTNAGATVAAAIVFKDHPKEVVEVPLSKVAGAAVNGRSSSALWQMVGADLSAYEGRNIATIGVIVKPNVDDGVFQAVDNYQLNIGTLTINDGENHTPRVAQDLSLDALFTDSSEAVISWDIDDYDTTRNYLLFADGEFISGRYDDNLYIKKLPNEQGTLQLYGVGVDGSRSLAASVTYDTSVAIRSLKAQQKSDQLTISWDTSSLREDADLSVSVEQRALGGYDKIVTVNATTGQAIFEDAPTDGSSYVVNVTMTDKYTLQTRLLVSQWLTFADTTIEPYPVCDVSWNDDGTATFVRPLATDWRYMRIAERWSDEEGAHEVVFPATYTYSQQTPPIVGIIRGRTKPSSYTVSLQHGGELYVSYEDYAGNQSLWQRVPNAGEFETCAFDDDLVVNEGQHSVNSDLGNHDTVDSTASKKTDEDGRLSKTGSVVFPIVAVCAVAVIIGAISAILRKPHL